MMKLNWYNSRVIKVLTHAAIWAVALSLPYLLDRYRGMHHHENDALEQKFFYLNLITNILWIGPFYLNAYVLTPKFLLRRRYLEFILYATLSFFCVLIIHMCLFRYAFLIPRFNMMAASGFHLPPFMLAIAISTAYRVVRDRMDADRRTQERQEETLKTELSFLRSQINPHFIFNILNNLVALEQMKSEELGPTILKLSSLMPYMLYETDEERVPLSREIEYLQSYIDLQRQRFGEKVRVTVSLDAPSGYYEIEPMLLIPFVENAFKHGVGMIETPSIDIVLGVSGGILHFSVSNKYNSSSEEVKDKTSGIGLGNVRRRLGLLYGSQHVLQITRDKDWFIVSLELNLH